MEVKWLKQENADDYLQYLEISMFIRLSNIFPIQYSRSSSSSSAHCTHNFLPLSLIVCRLSVIVTLFYHYYFQTRLPAPAMSSP